MSGEVHSLDASRELDALVHERVMGGTVDYSLTRRELMFPHYSADIAAAWMVVERMHHDGWWIDLERDTSGYLVVMEPFEPEDLRRTEQRADTAPLAICRAALAAVERGS